MSVNALALQNLNCITALKLTQQEEDNNFFINTNNLFFVKIKYTI